MTWQRLLEANIQKFIKKHEGDDVAALALKKPPAADWPYALVLDQIKARQKAARKIPLWAGHDPNIVFPPSHVMEQASSAATARYKAGLVKGACFVDLSGGAGVDACAFTEHFKCGIVVERDQEAAGLIAHNLPLLSNVPVEVICGDAESYVERMEAADLVYIDPQRRDAPGGRKGKYILEECSPNIFELLPVLRGKAEAVMIKTSPMLDIWSTVERLGCVRSVHVVEWRGDCKEVLYLLDPSREIAAGDVQVTAAVIDDEGEVLNSLAFTKAQEERAECAFSKPLKYLYEPSPAFQKAGGYKAIADVYAMQKLHPHTHLYTSDKCVADFPGRGFEVLGLHDVRAKAMPVKKANLKVRNFPERTDILRKKLKISDGGGDYLFACTLLDGEKAAIHACKLDV